MAMKKSKPRGIFERPLGSGVWWVRYVHQYGKEHREKVGAKSAAGDIYRQRKTEIRLGKFDPEDVKKKNLRPAMVLEIINEKMEVARGRLKGYRPTP